MLIENFESLDVFKTFKPQLSLDMERKSNVLSLIEVISIMTFIIRPRETLVLLLGICKSVALNLITPCLDIGIECYIRENISNTHGNGEMNAFNLFIIEIFMG